MREGALLIMRVLNVKADTSVRKSLYALLLIGGLYALSVSLSNTFVNIYIWKQTKSFTNVATYNLTISVLQVITFYFAGKLVTRLDRVVVLRIGVSLLSLFYIIVLLVGNNASHYLLLLGAILGMGYGFYWLSFNLLTFEVTEPDTRDFFNGFSGGINSFAGMIGPLGSGFIISKMVGNRGYTVVFFCSLFLFVCAVIFSFFLEKREKTKSYQVFHIVKERRSDRSWRSITRAHFCQGLREGTFVFVVAIYVYQVTRDELALGTYGFINSLVSFIMYYVAARYIKKENRKKAILLGGILLFFSVALITFRLTYMNFLLYAVFISIAYPILLVPYSSMTYDVIGHAKNVRMHRVEYIVVREWFLHGGRITSVVAFLITINLFDASKSIPIFLLIAGTGHALIYPNIKNIDIKEQKIDNGSQLLKKGDDLAEGEV